MAKSKVIKDFKSPCGCSFHIIKWSSARDVVSVKNCPTHKFASEMLIVLRKLRNEASGFLSMANRETHGNTNISVLQLRIDEASEVIGKVEGVIHEQRCDEDSPSEGETPRAVLPVSAMSVEDF